MRMMKENVCTILDDQANVYVGLSEILGGNDLSRCSPMKKFVFLINKEKQRTILTSQGKFSCIAKEQTIQSVREQGTKCLHTCQKCCTRWPQEYLMRKCFFYLLRDGATTKSESCVAQSVVMGLDFKIGVVGRTCPAVAKSVVRLRTRSRRILRDSAR